MARASRQGENRIKPTEKEEENSHTLTDPFLFSLPPRSHYYCLELSVLVFTRERCASIACSLCLLACVAKASLYHWHISNGKRIDANEDDDTGHEVRWRNNRLDRNLRGRMIRSERRSATRVGNRGFGEPQQRRREGDDYDDDRRRLLLAASSSPAAEEEEEVERQAASKQASACDAKKW